MNGQQYLILAYSAGLGLLTTYAGSLWIAARLARKQAMRLVTSKTIVTTAGAAGGVL